MGKCLGSSVNSIACNLVAQLLLVQRLCLYLCQAFFRSVHLTLPPSLPLFSSSVTTTSNGAWHSSRVAFYPPSLSQSRLLPDTVHSQPDTVSCFEPSGLAATMGLLDKLANKVASGGGGGGSSNRPYSQQYPGGGPGPQSPYSQQNPYGGGGYSAGSPGYGSQPPLPQQHQQQQPQPHSPAPAANTFSEKPKEDDRPLPQGWVKQWDNNYNRYFYVDTRATPPRSIWVHPNDEHNPASSAPSGGYAPPSGPPNDSRAWGQPPPPQQPLYGQPSYGGQPQYGGYPQPGFGGGYPQQPMYQQSPMMAQTGGRRFGGGGGGMGMAGGAALGLGAGLLGGALLTHEMDDAYQDGYQDGAQNDYGGGDYGGGDYGGGDDFGGDF